MTKRSRIRMKWVLQVHRSKRQGTRRLSFSLIWLNVVVVDNYVPRVGQRKKMSKCAMNAIQRRANQLKRTSRRAKRNERKRERRKRRKIPQNCFWNDVPFCWCARRKGKKDKNESAIKFKKWYKKTKKTKSHRGKLTKVVAREETFLNTQDE